MGNICAVSLSCDAIFSRCFECCIKKGAYVSELEDNFVRLQSGLEKLIHARNDVTRRVTVDEQQPKMKRTDQVQGWLSRVQVVEHEVTELQQLKDQETKKLCFGGYCSKNYKSSYMFGKRVHGALQGVTSLKSEEERFTNVAEKVPEDPVDELPIDPEIIGLQSTFDKVWRCLGDERVGIIGLYGMGGVGKTTLLTLINNKFLDTANDFDVVIWVEVSKDRKLEMVQDTIGKRIGFSDESWKNKRFEEKASDIFKMLSQKRFVLLLDDIWERVELTKMGVPIPSPKNASKIVFTTRSDEVCGEMEADKQFQVECLAPEEAWKLFQMKVGRETLESQPGILEIAKHVAKECGGLPLALITTGRAMARKKTIQEWNIAFQELEKSAFKFPGMGEKVYSLLKFSYDSLASDTLRSCLLYCSLFPEDYEIKKRALIDCWIGEGFFDEYDFGYSIIGDLLRVCLLKEKGNDTLKMHDVIRDMALWIACAMEKEKGMFLVQTWVGLTEAPEIGRWEEVKRMSLMGNNIKNLSEIPSCPHLVTLFLNVNGLRKINSDFFQFMSSLKVLDLSFNPHLYSFPSAILRLISLQYLDLSWTSIRELPEELKALANLRCLKLDNMNLLNRIPRRLISSFVKLYVFRLSFVEHKFLRTEEEDNVLSDGGKYLVEELLCLKNLNSLSIQLVGSCNLQNFLKSQKLQSCTQFLRLVNVEESLAVSTLKGMKHLDELLIRRSELKIDYCIGEIQKIQQSHTFHSLRQVSLFLCTKLRDATWLVFAPNIRKILVCRCYHMEEVISAEKCGQVNEIESLNPFAKLQDLRLVNLPCLKSIYWKPLQFPHLKRIHVEDCPNLDSHGVTERRIVIKGNEYFLEKLDREAPAA